VNRWRYLSLNKYQINPNQTIDILKQIICFLIDKWVPQEFCLKD